MGGWLGTIDDPGQDRRRHLLIAVIRVPSQGVWAPTDPSAGRIVNSCRTDE
ncbi:MAG: hypothetical protein ACRDJU_09705 [Actinomycetota bacterium]